MKEKYPDVWVKVSLSEIQGNVSYPIGDGDHGQIKPKCYTNRGVPYIRVSDLGWGDIKPENMVYIPESVHNQNLKSELKPGDILIAKTGATIGKCCILPEYIKKANTTSSVGKISLNKDVVLPKWVLYYFLTYEFKIIIWSLSNRTAQPGFNNKDLKEFKVPLPPLNEQRRIAAKLDKIMPRIERVKVRLERTSGLIKQFRQAVLHAAVTGKLTEKWREQHPDVESADGIIESIKKERIADAQKYGHTKIERLYNEIEKNDSDELPKNWKYTFLNKLCLSFQYGTSAKSQRTGLIPVIRMGNLKNGYIDWNDLVYTSNEEEIEKYSLKSGDVLFNRTNSADLVGKTSIYLGEQPAIFAGYLIRIINHEKLNSKYLNHALNSQYARNFCNRVKSDGVNQSNINAQKLGKFEIPLPPLEEQEEIVRQVDRLFAWADKMEEHYKKAKEKIEKLPQAVLAKAFRGELVRQDPSDEPARVLLERIKTQKAQHENDNKLTKSKKFNKISGEKNNEKRTKNG